MFHANQIKAVAQKKMLQILQHFPGRLRQGVQIDHHRLGRKKAHRRLLETFLQLGGEQI